MEKCKRYTVYAIGRNRDGDIEVANNYNEGHCTGEMGNCGCKHAEIALLEKMPLPVIVVLSISPCLNCAKALVKAGVSKVAYLGEYRIRDGIDYLIEHGVEVVNLGRD